MNGAKLIKFHTMKQITNECENRTIQLRYAEFGIL